MGHSCGVCWLGVDIRNKQASFQICIQGEDVLGGGLKGPGVAGFQITPVRSKNRCWGSPGVK